MTWSTPSQAPSVVKYGEKTSAMDHTATGESFKFQDGSLFMAPQWIHNVALKDLKFDTQYSNPNINTIKSKYPIQALCI